MNFFTPIRRFKHIILLVAALCPMSPLEAEQLLTIKGSDTLGTFLIPRLAEAWSANHPEVRFKIFAEGSGTGISALIHSQTDLAVSSRRARPSEFARARAKGVVLRPTLICQDGIAIIVNDSLPLENLGLDELQGIFTGEIKNWSSFGLPPARIELHTRNPSSGTYLDFQALALGRQDYALSINMLARNQQILAAVQRDPQGIGYVGMAYLRAPGIHVVAVETYRPNMTTVSQGSYPMTRPNFLYTNGEPTGNTRAFIDFVLSPAGQAIIRDVGFSPVREATPPTRTE